MHAQSSTGTGAEVLATDDRTTGAGIQQVPSRGATASSGPVYACYFAFDYLDGRGMSRQGDDFVHDTAGPDLIPGVWYGRQCYDDTGVVVDFSVAPYNPGAPGEIIDEVQVRDWARNNRLLPTEAFELDLSPDTRQVTGLETWIDQPSPVDIGPEWASAGSINVGIRGRLVNVEIDPGDGSPTFSCTPSEFVAWTSGASNPSCSHTYWEVSLTGSYEMTATYTWEFDWLPHDETVWIENFFSDTATAATPVPIVDLEAVISR